jgi:RHS repeat-associated protein
VAQSDLCFIYDGWNPVLTFDPGIQTGSGPLKFAQQYTWGLDLSGQSGNASATGIHGAGGIGGLLAATEAQGTTSTGDDESYWFLYDANGNVGQILDATDHDPVSNLRIAAHYEYDPYGNLILIDNDRNELDGTLDTADDGYANDNPIRFSTKWFDAEISLYYYGYRYYSPELGRWLSRDPIEELGGLNLYTFIYNDPSNFVDFLGLESLCKKNFELCNDSCLNNGIACVATCTAATIAASAACLLAGPFCPACVAAALVVDAACGAGCILNQDSCINSCKINYNNCMGAPIL